MSLQTWWQKRLPGRPVMSPRSVRGSGGGISPIFVLDTFQGTAGASLQSRIGEVGATWTKHPAYAAGGDARISNAEQLYFGTNPPPIGYYASGIPFDQNYSVFLRYRWLAIAGATDGGPFGRLDTVANTGYFGWYNAALGRWELYRANAGVITLMGNFVQAVVLNTDYEMELRMLGTSISIFIDTVLRIGPIVDATIAGPGRVGVRLFSAAPGSDVFGLHNDNIIGTRL